MKRILVVIAVFLLLTATGCRNSRSRGAGQGQGSAGGGGEVTAVAEPGTLLLLGSGLVGLGLLVQRRSRRK